jgi:hypothetical protein
MEKLIEEIREDFKTNHKKDFELVEYFCDMKRRLGSLIPPNADSLGYLKYVKKERTKELLAKALTALIAQQAEIERLKAEIKRDIML